MENPNLNGLLIYTDGPTGEFNIGDYVQSIAARQFLPQVDIYLNREHLNEPHSQEINLIANGWYMHQPQNWPPHQSINPLFVALHINKLAEKEMLSPESIAYFKKHEPIGCRDIYTMDNLRSHGVDAYFSGCMTLTLGKTYKRQPDNGSVYFTDAYMMSKPTIGFKLKALKNLVFKYPTIRAINKRQAACGEPRSLASTAAFYTDYSPLFTDLVMKEAVYRCQQRNYDLPTTESRFEYADKLLREYSAAHYVVTTRIHCALPCLAMGVPVMFVHNDSLSKEHNCRLNGLLQLFHLIRATDKGLKLNLPHNGKLDANFTFENKPDYKPLAEALTQRCQEFIQTNTTTR